MGTDNEKKASQIEGGLYHLSFDELSLKDRSEVFREGRLRIKVDADTIHLRLYNEDKFILYAISENVYRKLIVPETSELIGQYVITDTIYKHLIGVYIRRVTGCGLIGRTTEAELTFARGIEKGIALAEKRAELLQRSNELFEETGKMMKERESIQKQFAEIDGEIETHPGKLNRPP